MGGSKLTARSAARAASSDWPATWEKIRGGFVVARAWYNRRALNLHRAARRIAADGWPGNLTELPGVGRYTADAVARFAFDGRVVPADTNVRRVLERTGGEFGPESAQALMDLGATICLARIPRCEACPLAEHCPSRGRSYPPQRRQSRFEGCSGSRAHARFGMSRHAPAAPPSSTQRRFLPWPPTDW